MANEYHFIHFGALLVTYAYHTVSTRNFYDGHLIHIGNFSPTFPLNFLCDRFFHWIKCKRFNTLIPSFVVSVFNNVESLNALKTLPQIKIHEGCQACQKKGS
uniref:Uncharacterized protein n=1 Tax=Octactis speculum TaxID=3111310 RepID=A0A7S2GDA6_9STRA